ncbi:MAG: hypothetical protein HRU11_06250 [Parvularculaceae bacterium]|nr:hypothetical protein [Parvularculaceae bacterium]
MSLKSYLSISACSLVLIAGSMAHAASVRINLDGFGLSVTEEQTVSPFSLEEEGFDADGNRAAARVKQGTLGVYSENGADATAGSNDTLTGVSSAMPNGMIRLFFELDGSFTGGGLLEIALNTSVSSDDAFISNEATFDDFTSSYAFVDNPALATSFSGGGIVDDNVVFRTSDESSVNFALSAATQDGTQSIDTTLVVDLAFVSGQSFGFDFELWATTSNGETVDFFGTALLTGVQALDPVTRQVLSTPFSLNGSAGGDYVALAEMNSTDAAVPIPAAAWLMGLGAVALVRRQRR